ncbi:MAG: protein translocase subunit SecF [Patescibacteria group bacterium]
MTIIGMRKVSYTISGVLVGFSILALLIWGLKFGIDFTGGSLMEIEFQGTRPDQNVIVQALNSVDISNAIVQPTGENGLFLRLANISEEKHQEALVALTRLGIKFTEKKFDSIGPTIGAELKRNSMWALSIVLIMIVLYISWAFRQISRPMASWKYGVSAVIALFHDVFIPLGIFAYLGHYYDVEIDTLFITAILTVLGFSVHDTIVVFDRIRENLRKLGRRFDFEEVVEQSIKQTITRSINTSMTVFFVMTLLFFFGGVATKFFALTLLIGVFFGTYSSIFIASALLVTWYKHSLKRV